MLTCIIVSHAKPAWCWEAIESVLGQTHPAVQVVVIDSGPMLAAGYFRRWGNAITVIASGETDDMRQTKCLQGWCVNECFRRGLVKGGLVTFLSDDDVYAPDAFARFVKAAERGGDAWYGHAEVLEAAGSDWRTVARLEAKAVGGVGGIDLDCLADGMQVCVRRSALAAFGSHHYWPECKEDATHADGVFLSRLGKHCAIQPLDFLAGYRRITPDSAFTRPGEWNGPAVSLLHSEEEFGSSSVDCLADRKWWHCVDQPSTEVEVTEFVGGLVRALQPEVCVETGAYLGQTAQAIGAALARNGHGRLWTVEIDPAHAETAARHCAGLPVEVVVADARIWEPPGLVDFAWVDSGDPGERDADLYHLLKRLSPRGVLAAHDSGTQAPLRPKLLDLEARGIVKLLLLPTPRGVALLRKGTINGSGGF